VRDTIAAVLRAAPRFRGKARVGAALQRALPGSPLVGTTLHDGSRLEVDLRSPTERSAYWTGDYDSDVVRALAQRIGSGAVVVDVGANIGFYTVPLARAGARVFAFEPMAANHARLVRNVAANGLEERVTAVRVAVGETEGTLELAPEPGGAETGNAAPAEPGAANAVSVEVRPLDALAAELRIEGCDLVKIDVEGGELAVLRGAAALIGRHRPLIFAELNRFWMERAGWTEADLLGLAGSWGYEAEPCRGAGVDNILLVPR
jgi:FkbM family methyltransferase